LCAAGESGKDFGFHAERFIVVPVRMRGLNKRDSHGPAGVPAAVRGASKTPSLRW
jgi:hypothetical protein